MTGEKLKKLIYSGEEVNAFYGEIITSITFDVDLPERKVIFKGNVFNDDIIFIGINLGKGIVFKDCEFNKTLKFIDCRGAISDGRMIYSSHIELENTKVNDFLIDGGENKGVLIHSESEIGRLEINNLDIVDGGLVIYESIIHRLFDINGVNIIGDLSIDRDSSIEVKARIMGGTFKKIHLKNSKFTNDFNIFNGKSNRISIGGMNFEKNVSILNHRTTDNITILNTESNGVFSLELRNQDLNGLYLRSSKFYDEFKLDGNDCMIALIDMVFSKQMEGAITIGNSNIRKIDLKGANFASLTIDHCKVGNFNIDQFYNYANYSLITVEALTKSEVITDESIFKMSQSNLGESNFLDVDLGSFQWIEIRKTIFENIKFEAINWFTDSSLNSSKNNSDKSRVGGDNKSKVDQQNLDGSGQEIERSDNTGQEGTKKEQNDKEKAAKGKGDTKRRQENKEKDKVDKEGNILRSYIQKRSVYRQFKQALVNSGDKITSLRFKALEKEYYKKELLYRVPCWKKLFDKDRFILLVNQSNDYGLNWMKPVGITLLISLLFSLSLIPLASEKISYVPCFSLECKVIYYIELCQHMEVWPKIIDPTHDIEKIISKDVGFFIHALDYFWKVCLAYFIFQTIVAFRKYI